MHWKWRMASSAIALAEKVNAETTIPHSFFATDMLDVALFKSLLDKRFIDVPVVVYFHENQLTYPWNETEHKQRERHYAWINFTSMLAADKIAFSSDYHMEAVFKAIPEFLSAFPDGLPPNLLATIQQKSLVVSSGVDFQELETYIPAKGSKTRILWNHRWEHDKNPDQFFEILFRLKELNMDFELVVCGESFPKSPAIFNEAKIRLADKIVHWGYFPNRKTYIEAMKKCHVLPVTANQEFFGLSVMEAGFCGVKPLLPKRLSYPSLYAGCNVFYSNEEDLFQKLILEINQPSRFELEARFSRYQWQNLVSDYENMWLSL